MEMLLDGLTEALRLVVSGDPVVLHAVFVSLSCSLIALALAAAVAIPWGAFLGLFQPRAHRLQVFCLRVGMSVPTVAMGLLVFGLLSRRGPLGELDLLYSPTAIIVGELLLALPLLGSLVHGAVAGLDPRVRETLITLGVGRPRALLVALGEVRGAAVAALLATFGRCVTELGIAITVGGNLAAATRTLPTTIALELSRGEFGRALAPGILLVCLAAVVTLVARRFLERGRA